MIKEILKPETDVEKKIITDPDFIKGVMWGEPRKGHPEGKVIYHIGHVLSNVDKYSTSENRDKLRLLAIIHDCFKYKVDCTKPKSRDNDHAMFARSFAEKFITENDLLEIIELHDEAYNSWCEGNISGKWDKAEYRANQLIVRLGQSINLYVLFYRCDNETGDKNNENYNWFINLIMNRFKQ